MTKNAQYPTRDEMSIALMRISAMQAQKDAIRRANRRGLLDEVLLAILAGVGLVLIAAVLGLIK